MLTRDEVVENIANIYADEILSPANNLDNQLRRLIRAIRNQIGRFALIFAVANERSTRHALSARVVDELKPELDPVVLHLNGKESSLLARLLSMEQKSDPIFVHGIELLLPPRASSRRQQNKVLNEMQLSRERFSEMGRPLLLWMPEYVYSLIGQHAVDFWSWQSGGFFFEEPWPFDKLYDFALDRHSQDKGAKGRNLLLHEDLRFAFQQAFIDTDPQGYIKQCQRFLNWEKIRQETGHCNKKQITAEFDCFSKVFLNLLEQMTQSFGPTRIDDNELQTSGSRRKSLNSSLRNQYLEKLFQATSRFALEGIDRKAASSEAEARLNLGAIYTALSTNIRHDKETDKGRSREKEPQYLSAIELLNRHSKLVLLGDPGGGKSTFVNFVTLCMSGQELGYEHVNLDLLTEPIPDNEEKEKHKQEWTHGSLLPVRIILRDLAARDFPSSPSATRHSVMKFIESELVRMKLGRWIPDFKKELEQKGGLVLFDGLDEVPHADSRQTRTLIKEAVEHFATDYPRCRILVTSRIYAYQHQQWKIKGFFEGTLRTFTADQITCFVDRWYRHIKELRGLQEDDARGRAEVLKHAILHSPNLFELAKIPLLLTLTASLHAWRGGSLPDQREELYADTVDLLLDWWERPKMVRDADGSIKVQLPSLAEWLRVDRRHVRNVLNQQAYEAHRRQADRGRPADIPEDDLVDALTAVTSAEDITRMKLVDYLSQRSGLLLPRGVGIYTFPHRTFQEYLAACYLTDHDFPDNLARLVRNDPNRWREVAALAAAKAARGAISTLWQFIYALCPAKKDSGHFSLDEAWGIQIAGETMATLWDTYLRQHGARKEIRILRNGLVDLLGISEFPTLERAKAGISLAVLQDPRPGVTHVDAMEFCLVPAGRFWMGSKVVSSEKVHFQSCTNYDYWISQYPITNAQFQEFIEAGDYGNEAYWQEAKRDGIWSDGNINEYLDHEPRSGPLEFKPPFSLSNHPVVGITWYEALAFTRWLTDRWRNAGVLTPVLFVQLPSEAEWEKAARGGEKIPVNPLIVSVNDIHRADNQRPKLGSNSHPKREFPWGEPFNGNLANGEESGLSTSNAVGCFAGGKSPYGCEELSGNVWEWTRSQYKYGYPYYPKLCEKAPPMYKHETISLRGGSFSNFDGLLRCSYRYGNSPDLRNDNVGFRVVLTPFSTSDL